MQWILGKYSTRIPSVLRQMCPMFCIVMNLWTIPTIVPKQNLMLGSDSPFQDITQSLRIRKPLHASSNINCSDISNICFKVRFSPCIFDGMHIVCVILSHEYRCFPCRRHKHSPNHRTFIMSCIESSGERFSIFRSRSFTLFRNEREFKSKGPILRRCQSPYQYRRQTCQIRVSPYLFPKFHQISVLEKTTCRPLFHSEEFDEASQHYRSPRTCLLHV